MPLNKKENRKLLWKVMVIIVVIALAAAFWALNLGKYVTLSYIKASQAKLDAMYAGNAAAVITAYLLAYIVLTAVSLPGAAVMTLLGGAIFGLAAGTVIVSFASTIGATLACAVSRFLLRDWVQGKFGDKLTKINEGIESEGAFYLFTLRLVPVFPFFVINLVMGLTKMPLITYYWVSQAGMLAGTVVYVNAGKELAKIDSLSGILSPRLIFSFALLGAFPLIVKKTVNLINQRKLKKK